MTYGGDGIILWDANDASIIGKPMKHKNAIVSAEFNKEETQILARSDFFDNGTVHLWFIEVDEDFPKRHLPLMVKVATGTTMDDYGNVKASSNRKWEEHRAEYIRIADEHLKICKHKNANIYLNFQKQNCVRN